MYTNYPGNAGVSMTLDLEFHHLLAGLFDAVVVDEAPCVKNADSQRKIYLNWLAANFVLLISATTIVSGVLDCERLLKPFLRKDAAARWTKDGLERMSYDDSISPFEELDDRV